MISFFFARVSDQYGLDRVDGGGDLVFLKDFLAVLLGVGKGDDGQDL